MRTLALTCGVALTLSAGAASAQLVDPRTAAGAAGEITGQVTPDIETPAEIDRERDPTAGPRPPAPGINPSSPNATLTPAQPPIAPPAAGGPPRTTPDSPTTAEAQDTEAADTARTRPAPPKPSR